MTIDDSRVGALREAGHPVMNDRALRLGTFSSNLSGGAAMTTIDGALEADWAQTSELARLGDEMEFEALVPVGRWRGFGGQTDFNAAGFECFTWAAGLGAQTERAGLFATSHVPTIHPILAAKQAATIDHISGGRFALNIVTGWNAPEIEMFGAPLLPHDERYEVAQEWTDIIRALWTSNEPYDFEGRYFTIKGATLLPKPVQRPHPVLMNVGSSLAGRHFGARNCDVLFANTDPSTHTPAALAEKVREYKRLARDEYGREVRVWTNAYVVQGDTEQDARDFLHHYVRERGDWEAADNMVGNMLGSTHSLPDEVLQPMKFHFIAGWGGYPLVGTAERIVDSLADLVDAGLDGVLLSWPRYIDGMRRFQQEIHPLLIESGLR